MAKLFSLEDLKEEEVSVIDDRNDFLNISEELEDSAHSLELAVESVKTASEKLILVQNISGHLDSQKRTELSYFTSLEHYKPVLESIATNLGVKSSIPSLEDFKNPYGTEASHAIAMEGLYDWIKKIWQKIKEVFVAFFKKVTLFLKRLLKYDLELEEYERYLEKAMVELKSKKPNINDNKVIIDSKLPSLLAYPGMEKVNSDFILQQGDLKSQQLVRIINDIFLNKLSKISNEEIKVIYDSVNKLVALDFTETENNNELILYTDTARKAAIQVIERLFTHNTENFKSLPETVYNAIQYQFTREEISKDMKINSLINSNDNSQTLPNNFNCYFVNYGDNKVFVSASVETNTYVENKVNPITNVNNLIMFYENYKKYSNAININKLNNGIESIQKNIDKLIEVMKNRYSENMDKVQLSVKEKGKTDPTLDMIYSLKNHVSILEQYAPEYLVNIINKLKGEFSGSRQRVDINKLLSSEKSIYLPEIKKLYEDNISNQNDFNRYLYDLMVDTNTKIYDEKGIDIKPESYLVRGSSVNLIIDPFTVKTLEEFQKFLLNFLTNFQVLLKTLITDLLGVYTELKYEYVRYIYKCSELYKA